MELVLEFGQDGVTKNYKCRILEPNGPARLQLGPFVETLSQRTNKLFPAGQLNCRSRFRSASD